MEIKKYWGVFYTPTKQGRIFAGLKPELVNHFSHQPDAIDFCNSLNETFGELDDLHKGYEVKMVNEQVKI